MTLINIGLNLASWTIEDVSDDVPLTLEVQRRLKAWGYDVGTPDGDWGTKTQRAYGAFAKIYKFDDRELSPAAARQLLKDVTAPIVTPIPAPSPAPKPVMPKMLRDVGAQLITWPIVNVIDNVPLALDIQRRLKIWNYNVGAPDGDWGPTSQRAYSAFAKDYSLKDTELSPVAARQLLSNPTPPKVIDPTPIVVKPVEIKPIEVKPVVVKAPTTLKALADQTTSWPIATLRSNATFTREVQQRLTVWRQAPGVADGDWGAKTDAAYSAFAKAFKFEANRISRDAAIKLLEVPPVVVPPVVVPPAVVIKPIEVKPVGIETPIVPVAGLPANLRVASRGTTTFPMTQVSANIALAREIQLSLDTMGYGLGSASGQWGPRSQNAYDRFSLAYKLDNKTLSVRSAKLLLEPEIPGIPIVLPAPPKLAMADYQAVANAIRCEVAAVRAVVSVEAAGSGFYNDGRPKILFEAHWFGDLTDSDYDDDYPSISSPVWNRSLYIGGVGEWDRLYLACTLDRAAAMKSASWGLGQVMGFNHKAAGYADVETFVRDMHLSEGKQLMAMFNFIKTNGLDRALIRRDWAAFARGYNGEGYRANAYDEKLQDSYEYWVSVK
jgi:peptidoglycan hydrolase-like protein with peptidoglycan-binding domain